MLGRSKEAICDGVRKNGGPCNSKLFYYNPAPLEAFGWTIEETVEIKCKRCGKIWGGLQN